ncbi:hypothetical protein ACH4VX_18340 [Streptomyces sp. NPDC020731]|uniref:hypothetical protein n=1 Tax=Streptomyces sp. NPDC020731 TaxID=3365085 RepID=UPI00378A8253
MPGSSAESTTMRSTPGALVDRKAREAGTWGVLPARSTVAEGAVLSPRLEERPTA